jgi:hypothetical protein
MDDMLKAASATTAAFANSPTSYSQELCPFSTAYGMSMYKYYEQRPAKAARFAQAMNSWSQRMLSKSSLRRHEDTHCHSGSTDLGAPRYLSMGVAGKRKGCGYWGRKRPHLHRTCAREMHVSTLDS